MAYTTINDPSEYFHTQLYTGDGNDDRSITNDANAGDFKPDWLWIKQRNTTRHHMWVDSNRGATKHLSSSLTNAENTNANGIQAFETDGFQLGTDTDINQSSGTYVAWQWKANGGTTTTNDASATSVGTIDSVYQANTTAGLSIVTYTGTGSAGTIAHGLGATPTVYIIKNRERSDSWRVAAEVLGYGDQLLLNDTDAEANDNNTFNNTAPTSTVFSVGTRNAVNANGEGHVAWVFAPKQGYSHFGTYKGNGDADGPFVYTGFKPAFLIIKNTAVTEHWVMHDNKRPGYNGNGYYLYPNLSNAEVTNNSSHTVDFLSNGFKIRSDNDQWNDAETMIYMCFGQSLVGSNNVPNTAV